MPITSTITSTSITATGSLSPASPSSISTRRRCIGTPRSSANTAAPSVGDRIAPSSSPSAIEKLNNQAANRPVTTAVNAVPTIASDAAGASTGRSLAKPVCNPPSNRIATSAAVPMKRARR